MTTASNHDIKFKDGTKVQRKDAITYLGCEINSDGNIRKELNKRISQSMVALKKLDIFWRHSNCPTKFKIIALDAVLRSKLLYGMNTAQLNEPQMKRINLFQLKALRKILKLTTTFVNRENTNKKVFDLANEQVQREGGTKEIIPFKKAYMCSKLKQLKRIINQNCNEPTRTVTFRRNLEVWQQPNRRQGRPKYKWASRALIELWDEIKEKQPQHRTTTFNIDNDSIQNILKEYSAETSND